MNNFVTLRNIQHASGNRTLKGHALGSADKYTTLLPLAWPIKPVSTEEFFRSKRRFAEFYWLATFFEVIKSRIQSYFLSFSKEKSCIE